MEPIIQSLLRSSDLAIQYQTRMRLLGEDANSSPLKTLQQQIKTSTRAAILLSERDGDGKIPCHPYAKWYGAHWVLVSLAEMSYPPGDLSLIPLREQVLDWLLSNRHAASILTIQGRVRRCASQESNALFSLLSLGLADERVDTLVKRLIQWQWPDGGWNCDKNPDAIHSSFMETITPLRGLALYARMTGDPQARAAAERAAEVFLKRQLFKRQSTGEVMDAHFLQLHFPLYWHYDILHGLKVLTDAGFIQDERCSDALLALKSKQLAGGGFPAEARYYRAANLDAIEPISERVSGYSLVNWNPTGKTQMNEFVTVNALEILQAGKAIHLL